MRQAVFLSTSEVFFVGKMVEICTATPDSFDREQGFFTTFTSSDTCFSYDDTLSTTALSLSAEDSMQVTIGISLSDSTSITTDYSATTADVVGIVFGSLGDLCLPANVKYKVDTTTLNDYNYQLSSGS